jgi:hypothetical protein
MISRSKLSPVPFLPNEFELVERDDFAHAIPAAVQLVDIDRGARERRVRVADISCVLCGMLQRLGWHAAGVNNTDWSHRRVLSNRVMGQGGPNERRDNLVMFFCTPRWHLNSRG